MERFLIDYNPYSNEFNFDFPNGFDSSSKKNFSSLTSIEHAFTHRLDDLIEKLKASRIDDVDCRMLKRDYLIFEKKAAKNEIKTTLTEEYSASEDTIKFIQDCYDKIKESYDGYYKIINDNSDSKIKSIQTHKKEIASLIKDYTEVVSDVIRLAFVSEYSGGKSCLINSIIGKKLFKESPHPTTQFIHELSYSEDDYKLVYEYSDGTMEQIPVNDDEKLRKELEKLTEDKCPVAKNLRVVHVECPFETSVLKIDGKYKIVFIDTPGPSGNGYDTEKLYAFFKGEIDTLPIFVLKEDSTHSIGNKGIFKNMGFGNFATVYRFVFMNQCDILNSEQVTYLDSKQKDNLIDGINKLYSNPTIICGSAKWYLEEKCKNVGVDNPDIEHYRTLLRHEVSKYNHLYEGENWDDPCGVGILENQINIYIANHAEYQKCLKARKRLMAICNLSNNLYKELSEEEKTRKKTKINEFNKKINDLVLTSAESIVDNICKIQMNQIDQTIKRIDENLKAYTFLSKKEIKEEQQEKKVKIYADFNKQYINCIKQQKKQLKDEAIAKLNSILDHIEKDGSVPLEGLDDIKGVIVKSNKDIKALSEEDDRINLFKNLIAPKYFAKREIKKLLKEDTKNNKFKGKLKDGIEKAICKFYNDELSKLYNDCKDNIKLKLQDISLIIRGITDEIEQIDNYNRVINDVKNGLDSCFLKQRR